MGLTMSSSGTTTEPLGTQQPSERLYADANAPVKSLSSVSRATLRVHNTTGYQLELLWLNYSGTPVSYGQLPAGKTVQVRTYHTHPWCVAAVGRPDITRYLIIRETGKQIIFPNGPESEWHIQLADSVPWTPQNHMRLFAKAHPRFHAQVHALLLGQYHMRTYGSEVLVSLEDEDIAVASSCPRRSASCRMVDSFLCLPRTTSSPGGYVPSSISEPGDMPLARVPIRDVPYSYSTPANAWAWAMGLRALPTDLLLEIIARMAPGVPNVKPTLEADMVLPSADLMEQHLQAVAIIQQIH